MDYKPPFRFVCEPGNHHLLDADGTRIDLEDACALLNSSLTDLVPEGWALYEVHVTQRQGVRCYEANLLKDYSGDGDEDGSGGMIYGHGPTPEAAVINASEKAGR